MKSSIHQRQMCIGIRPMLKLRRILIQSTKLFADEPRNVRFGLASDEFNLFGDISHAYSIWPVMVMPYNLSSWMCIK